MSDEREHPDTCPETVFYKSGYQQLSRTCGRTFKNDEQRESGLCGIHLRAQRKREERAAEEDARRRSSAASLERANWACATLESLNITAKPYYLFRFGGGMGRYTGEVVVDGEELLQALEDKQ